MTKEEQLKLAEAIKGQNEKEPTITTTDLNQTVDDIPIIKGILGRLYERATYCIYSQCSIILCGAYVNRSPPPIVRRCI